jgi:hypothetical protein
MILGAFIGLASNMPTSGSSGPTFQEWSVTTDCAGTSFYSVYTAYGQTLDYGTYVYQDQELTSPYANQAFSTGLPWPVGVFCNTDSNGMISFNETCPPP